jgi:hypothetical protein
MRMSRVGERDDAGGVAPHAGVVGAEGEPEGVHPGRGRVLRTAAEGDAGDEDGPLVQEPGDGVLVVEVDLLKVEEVVEVDADDGRVVVDVAPRPGEGGELDGLLEREQGGDLRAELERQRGDAVAAGAVAGVSPGLLAVAPAAPTHLSRHLALFPFPLRLMGRELGGSGFGV